MNSSKPTTSFRKSSYSGGDHSNCVEIAVTADGGRAARDSKNPAHGTTHHSPTAWAAFLTSLRDGTLGH
ncbi:DUF397 domain-containing protein [Streptomyces daliensis]|uniref:DUF397 domain-containing protein n=1 Tax=Streptomyces daliensis TaxID=299421 RepID=A0A8T4ITW5_9ACTN|nr:DUF397 domain-containing protein [Streptomyces daliensis]